MGISKILDKKYKNSKTSQSDSMTCVKNISDCAYITKNGMCSSEWCIYEELPNMVNTEKEIKCVICDKPKIVSIYSRETNYICPECQKDIDKIFKNPTCSICGTKTTPGQSICESCATMLKEKLNERSDKSK